MEPTNINSLHPSTCVELAFLREIVSPSVSMHNLHRGRNDPVKLHVNYTIQGTAKTLHFKELKPTKQNRPDPPQLIRRRRLEVPETVNSRGNAAALKKDLNTRAVTNQRKACKYIVNSPAELNTPETKSDLKINKNSGGSQCGADNSASNFCTPVNAPSSSSNTKNALKESNSSETTSDTSRTSKTRAQDLHLSSSATNKDHIFDPSMETISEGIDRKCDIITETSHTESNDSSDAATKLVSDDDESPSLSSRSSHLWRTDCLDITDSHSETSQSTKSNAERLEKCKYSYLYGTDNSSNNEYRLKVPYTTPPPLQVKLSKTAGTKTSNSVNKKDSDNKPVNSLLFVSGQRASSIGLYRRNESMRVYESTESYRISRTERYVRYLLWKENSARSRERLANIDTQRPWKPNY